MSEHPQSQNTKSLNADLVAFIIICVFSGIGLLLFANMKLVPLQRNEDSVEVAQAEATATLLPNTPIPPTATATLLPTNTPAPTAMPTVAVVKTPQSAVEASSGESAGTTDPALVSQGEQLFMLCSACHGSDGRGLPNLGKDLVASEFVAGLTDQELLDFIKVGRPIWDPLNTTGIDMPGKGGNPAMTDDDIWAIITYIRDLSAQAGDAVEVSAPISGAELAYDPALVAEGEQLFLLCSACHGSDGRGLPNLGKDLVMSEFVAGLTDQELLDFIKTGRPIWDTLNTTGIDMPAKGGNPAMTDDDIWAIIAYVRSLSSNGG